MADEEEQDNHSDESEAPPAAPSWTPPASQEDLDKIIAARVARVEKKFKDYDDLKARAARADALDNELASETEKAIRAAREEERAKVQGDYTPRLVRAAFKAEAKGVLSTEQLNSLIEDIDLGRFVTDDGDVDEEKIAKKVSAFAPKEEPPAPQRRATDFGQGQRSAPPSKGVDAGRSRYEATHKKPTPQHS